MAKQISAPNWEDVFPSKPSSADGWGHIYPSGVSSADDSAGDGFTVPGIHFPAPDIQAGQNFLKGAANTAIPLWSQLLNQLPRGPMGMGVPGVVGSPAIAQKLNLNLPTKLPFPEAQGQPGATAGNILGGFAMPMPGIGEAAPFAEQIPGLLTKLGLHRSAVPLVSSILSKHIPRAAIGAAQGMLASPDDQSTGAQVGASLGLLAPGVARVIKPLLSSTPVRNVMGSVARGLTRVFPGIGSGTEGQVTATDFFKNIGNQPAGMKIPLGNIAASPGLTKIQTLLGMIPLSGAAKPIEEIGQHVNMLLNQLENPANVTNVDLQNANLTALKDFGQRYAAQKNEVTRKYDLVGKRAATLRAKLDPSTIVDTIDKQIEEIKSSAPVGSARANAIATLLEKSKELRNLPRNEQELLQTGRIVAPTVPISKALALRNELSTMSSNYLDDSPSSRILKGKLGGINHTIDESIHGAAIKAKDSEFSSLLDDARAERVKQADIFEKDAKGNKTAASTWYNKAGNPDEREIQNYINSGVPFSTKGNDFGLTTEKFIASHSKGIAPLVGAHILRSEGTMAQKIARLNKMSIRQRDAIYGKNNNAVKSVLNISKMFPDAKSPFYTPQTGASGEKVSQALKYLSALSAGVGAAQHSLLPMVLPVGTVLGARGASSLLRSNALKGLYLRGLLTREIPILKKPGYDSTNALKRAGLGLLSSNQTDGVNK